MEAVPSVWQYGGLSVAVVSFSSDESYTSPHGLHETPHGNTGTYGRFYHQRYHRLMTFDHPYLRISGNPPIRRNT